MVAVVALPFKAAVIILAEKLPEAFRKTKVEAVLEDVAAATSIAAVATAEAVCPPTNIDRGM